MLNIIVPYRDRNEHLKQFIPHMNKYVPEAKIIVVEQAGSGPFNRGRLLNIGFLEYSDAAFFCFHDVDMLPIQVDYSEEIGVTQLAYSEIQKVGYLGGVTMFDSNIFLSTGGYHNDYFHRAEDNEMRFRLKQLKIPVRNRFGQFRQLPHSRSGLEFIPELWQKAQIKRTSDMLKSCKYDLIFRQVQETHTHITVSLL